MTPGSTINIDPVTITLVGGMIITIVSAIATAIVSIITAAKLNNVKTDQATTAATVLAVARDTEAIKGHVNSERTASEGRELSLQKENALLREMVTHEKITASLLAQAAAGARTPGGRSGDVAVVTADAPVVSEILDKIETNTAAIDRNTAGKTS